MGDTGSREHVDLDALGRALGEAAADAIRRHRRLGVPVAVRVEGESVILSADDITLPGERPKHQRRKPA